MATLDLGTTEHGPMALPLDAQTTTFGIIGRRGSGKTSTAVVLAEEMIGEGLAVVVLDPLGVWHGLRSSKDGEHEGLPVTILGGNHGDLPIERTAGSLVADLIVEHPGAYVLDLSAFESRAAERQFATDFAERLYRAKAKDASPLCLIVDEADTFAPQQVRSGEERLLGAFEAIARRGRVRGLGMVLITQRPAVLNKNLLSQVECLIAMQITAPQDRDALKAWAQGFADKPMVETFVDSLAPLKVGEAWLWSPSWLGIFERVNIRQRHTFDSSATPKAGEVRVTPVVLASVDLEVLRSRMAESIERAEADDPKKLRAEVARLKRELAERPVIDCGHETIIETLKADLEHHAAELGRIRIKLHSIASILEDVDGADDRSAGRDGGDEGDGRDARPSRVGGREERAAPVAVAAPTRDSGRQTAGSVGAVSARPRSRSVGQSEGGGLSKAERAILTALAQYPQGRSRRQVGILTGYSSKSGGFNGAIAGLRSKGFATPKEPLVVTSEGIEALGEFEPLPTGEALLEHWYGQLDKAPAGILRTLAAAYPQSMTRDEVAAALGYSASSGGFNGALAKLRTLELIERGTPRLSDDFFGGAS
jgi:hypothetical protein